MKKDREKIGENKEGQVRTKIRLSHTHVHRSNKAEVVTHSWGHAERALYLSF